jgi:hypothetical protein
VGVYDQPLPGRGSGRSRDGSKRAKEHLATIKSCRRVHFSLQIQGVVAKADAKKNGLASDGG